MAWRGLQGGPLWGWGLLATEVARVLRELRPHPHYPSVVCPEPTPCQLPPVSCSCPEQHCQEFPVVSCPAPVPCPGCPEEAAWDPPAVLTAASLTASLVLQLGLFCSYGRRIAPRRHGAGVLERT